MSTKSDNAMTQARDRARADFDEPKDETAKAAAAPAGDGAAEDIAEDDPLRAYIEEVEVNGASEAVDAAECLLIGEFAELELCNQWPNVFAMVGPKFDPSKTVHIRLEPHRLELLPN